MATRKRNYTRERLQESKERKNKRNNRNKFRRLAGLKVGDGKVANHKDGNAMNNSRSNLSVQSRKASNKQGGSKGGPKSAKRRKTTKRSKG